jgi:uncharacterized protein YjiS (DUF1127 family)
MGGRRTRSVAQVEGHVVTKLSVVPIAAGRVEGKMSLRPAVEIFKKLMTVIVLSAPRRAYLAVSRLIRFWIDYDQSVRELGRLSDYELADMRVNRWEISRLAWDEAWLRLQSRKGQSFSRE